MCAIIPGNPQGALSLSLESSTWVSLKTSLALVTQMRLLPALVGPSCTPRPVSTHTDVIVQLISS